jgi:hypothetical protein
MISSAGRKNTADWIRRYQWSRLQPDFFSMEIVLRPARQSCRDGIERFVEKVVE